MLAVDSTTYEHLHPRSLQLCFHCLLLYLHIIYPGSSYLYQSTLVNALCSSEQSALTSVDYCVGSLWHVGLLYRRQYANGRQIMLFNRHCRLRLRPAESQHGPRGRPLSGPLHIPPLSPPLPFPSLPSEVGPLNPARGSRGAL